MMKFKEIDRYRYMHTHELVDYRSVKMCPAEAEEDEEEAEAAKAYCFDLIRLIFPELQQLQRSFFVFVLCSRFGTGPQLVALYFNLFTILV